MDFNSIIGQKDVIDALKRSLSKDRVGHAYIFSGPAGIGKKTISHVYAGLLLCEKPHSDSTCGKCTPCILYENGTNPDFNVVNTEENSIGVDMIREIQKDVAIRPMYSRHKVYIIEDAGKMTVQAQNCLLKTFEEPPAYVVVILLADNYDMLLETIKSRAQRLNFKKYAYEQVLQAVVQKYGKDSDSVRLAAEYSDGNIGTALEFAGSGEFAFLRDSVFELVPQVTRGKMKYILEFESLVDENRDSINLILDIMLLYYRDIMVIHETGNENLLINSDKKDIILNNAKMYQSARIMDSVASIEDVRRLLKQNVNYQLAIDNMLIKLRED